MNALSHLDPRIHKMMERSSEERVGYIMAEKFVPYPLAVYLIDEVKSILSQDAADRYKCMLIYAAPGGGKTMILNECRRVFANKRIRFNADLSSGKDPFVLVSLPPISDLRVMYFRILDILHIPYAQNDKIGPLHEQVCRALHNAGTRILGIDEIHNILLAKKDLEACMAAIRDLANLPLSLLCAGTLAARHCIAADEQLRVRFRCHELLAWQISENTRNFLATLEARLPLEKPSHLSGSEMMPLIIRLSQGHIGTMVVAVREAARDAVRSGEEVISEKGIKLSVERVLSQRLKVA
ncbi:TniB family NTP-binding protein [Dyella sp. GSA-30]|uniref:TniB family NTP-binding protein n=1 Tax=Dyella sp. GSA-30 TaxID=2994496 RepID=UPI002491A1C4|nr:TniB family NTP-binding protein [Dyella sp. GSA-30]BDU21553.1 transposition protein TniB [Dyella sp. GSA-30]